MAGGGSRRRASLDGARPRGRDARPRRVDLLPGGGLPPGLRDKNRCATNTTGRPADATSASSRSGRAPPPSMPAEDLKRQAAHAAVEMVEDGMALGLGTGSTAAHAVRRLGVLVGEGLSIVGVPTSEDTAALAREVGLPLGTLDEHPVLDLTIDGRRRNRPRAPAHQGRRRGLAAREDRRGSLQAHGRDCRRVQAGRDARRVSPAHRGRPLRRARDAAGHRGRRSRCAVAPARRHDAAAMRRSSPTRDTIYSTRGLAGSTIPNGWQRISRPFRAWWSTGSS